MAEDKKVASQAVSLCCGGPAPEDSEACCVQDADAKASGEVGCGCYAVPRKAERKAAAASCCG